MPGTKTITFSLPTAMGREVEKLAKEEHRTVSELLRESFRQYRALRILDRVAAKGRALAAKKGLTEKDFGGPLPSDRLTACVDANVLISAIAFGGNPLQVLRALLKQEFAHVTCQALLDEASRNLTGKLGLSVPETHAILGLVQSYSTLVDPKGTIKAVRHAPDNLVLETALLGGCDVLVTGDKRHLLPLRSYRGVAIETPSVFLKRLA